ncbi:hypothetical protein GCM10009557_61010 [Virgisporangium ochraceum]
MPVLLCCWLTVWCGAVGTAAVGVLVAGVAAIVPTVLLRRLPAARLLAEE